MNPVENRRHGGSVLVADDEEMVLRITKRMLEKCGYSVVTAGNGEEAVAQYEKSSDNIVLVMLDQSMPRMTGDAAFHRIREINPQAKVVLASGDGQAPEVQALLEQGLTGIVDKPYEFSQFSDRLQAFVDS